MKKPLVLAGLLLALLLPLAACGGGSSKTEGKTPEQVLAGAKDAFDHAKGISFELSTRDEPKGGNAILSAQGRLNRQPAFTGQAEVLFGGIRATVPVTAVGGKVYAKLPLTGHYATIDPADYGIPDPAAFIDPDSGISTLLTKLEKLKKQGQTRDGGQILTTYDGRLPSTSVISIIPSAAQGDYDTVIGIDQGGKARTIEATGPFFGAGTSVTYRIALTSYTDSGPIKKP